MRELWERQALESHKAFSAFMTYRDMRPAQRSLPVAYRLFTGDPTKAKVCGQWRRWVQQHSWEARVVAYDRHLDNVRRAAAETVVAEVEATRVREIEVSARATLEEMAALAHSNITDILEWDEAGNITLKPSKDLPPHMTAAIAKMRVVYDKNGNPHLTIKMHPKVRPLDLLGQHFSLWDREKKQEEKAATNSYLELLAAMKAGKLDKLVEELKPSLLNPPPGITITQKAPMTAEEIEKEKDHY